MKRFITTVMVLCLVFSFSFTTVNAASKTKYVKVKSSTIKEYKKIAKENKKLKEELDKSQKSAKALEEKLESAESKSNWVWMQIYSLGLSYNNKKWSVPRTIPNKFMVNGVTYYAEWE